MQMVDMEVRKTEVPDLKELTISLGMGKQLYFKQNEISEKAKRLGRPLAV